VNQSNDIIPNLKAVQSSAVLCRPLYVRAKETGAKAPAIRDPKAVEIANCLELDAAIMEGSLLNSHVILTRTVIIDHAVKNFCIKKAGIVINLGAGLDTRVVRLGNGQTRWYDVDIPEIIAFRRAFIRESAEVRFLAKSLLDPAWVKEFANREVDTPVLIIAEGLFSNLTTAEVQQLLDLLTKNFPGSEMYCDVVDNRLVGRGAPPFFKWGLAKAKDIEQLHPRLQLIEHWRIKDFQTNRQQLLTNLWNLLKPPAQKRLQVLRVRFK
jgi:O-methyltransferase involved in polyketide biosynthesis